MTHIKDPRPRLQFIRWFTAAFLVIAKMLPAPLILSAQTQPPSVKCEVASIKPTRAADGRRRELEFLPGGRFRAVNVPLFQVVATAYGVPWQSVEALQSRIKNIPDWMFSESYDIDAKAENPTVSGLTAKARNERIRLMLQSLLKDRLKFTVRYEEGPIPAYALLAEKSGPKLPKAKTSEETCTESAPFGPISNAVLCHHLQGGTGRGIHGTAIDMSDLALFLSNWSDRPIVDSTGIKDLFAIDTEGWSPSGDDPSRSSLDDILAGIGLKLVPRRVPIQTIVIEHVERPSAN